MKRFFRPCLNISTALVSAAILSGASLAMAQTPLPAPGQPSAPNQAQAQQLDMFTQALTSAYMTNPQIRAQREALKATDEGVNQALSNFRPTITANYQNGRQKVEVNGTNSTTDDVEIRALNLNQPLFRGGRTLAAYSRTRNEVRAGREDLRDVEQNTLLSGITAYMDVLQNQSIVELSRNNEDVLQEQLRAAQQRFDVGEVTRTDVAQAQARLARAKADTVEAVGNLESAMASFERVIGFAPDQVLTVPQQFPTLPVSLDEALDVGLKRNAALLAANYQYEAADDAIYEEIGVLLPEVSLQGSMQKSDSPNAFDATRIDTDALLLNVSIPLYQSGAEHSRVRAAKKRAKQQQYARDDQGEAVREGIVQAWEDWQTSIATIAAQKSQINAAEVALEGVKQEQRFGERTVLDVLDAEQELFAARVALVQAQRNRIVSIYNLVATLGQLTANDLSLPVPYYDPSEHYDDVQFQFLGW